LNSSIRHRLNALLSIVRLMYDQFTRFVKETL
jgi:hypothetical protein